MRIAITIFFAFASSAALAQGAPAANAPRTLSQFSAQACPQGQERNEAGLCVARDCPTGYVRNPTSGLCAVEVTQGGPVTGAAILGTGGTVLGIGNALLVGGGIVGVGVAGALVLTNQGKKTVSP